MPKTSSPLPRAPGRQGSPVRPPVPHPDLAGGPIRGELLGDDRLAERARSLARSQKLAALGANRRHAPLLERLNGTRRILESAHERLALATARDIEVGPAADWLLDNFHVVDEHLREVRESLPRGYYRELPQLAAGPLAGYPRVYEIAITLISHTEARLDLDKVGLVVDAFQEVRPLSIGELWALPAMLRLGLIESVRRMTLRTVERLDEVEAADRLATRIHDGALRGETDLRVELTELVAAPPRLSPTFVARFLQQLRASDDPFTPLAWIEQWIAEDALTLQEASAQSARRLAQTQVGMANSITSLRVVARMKWRAFVEGASRLEAALSEDPSGFYPQMTFATRDRYRHTVERIAKRTRRDEAEVAREAVALARAAAGEHDARRAHVGYYLVGEGLPAMERVCGYRPSPREALRRWGPAHPNVVFIGGLLVGTIAALALVIGLAGAAGRAAWILVVVLGLIPATEIALLAVNQFVTALLPPRTLPKLDFSERGTVGGIPQEDRTAVVVPTLFGSVAAVREALENLEIQFLANREPNLHFAVLSDFTDADAETRPGDEAIVAAAAAGVRGLNARHAAGREDLFYLFHRPRRWNPSQGVWMGWERKRGKLSEFNRFVRRVPHAERAFSTIVGDVEAIRGVRYVITLDSDTVLPPGAAALLVGTLAHPLNRAVFDSARGRVVRGYGIIQPRVGVSLPSAYRSRFAALHSGHPGVDPYTTAVSDVYQDLYGEGSFTGKGIYDVDAFERATHGRFPENTLLSHDLIEGNYARAGLATDIELYDDYPTRYLSYARRKHRWIRGDWQLLPWLGRHVPGPNGPERNRLTLLSRWKILDNLRRSTVEVAQFLFLVAGWTVLPGSPLRWTLLGILAIAAPWLLALGLSVLRPPLDKSWRAYYAAVGRDTLASAQQFALAVTFLPHQAWISADAIARTLWRRYVSHRSLLEWQTASQAERATSLELRETWRRMRPAVVMVIVVTLGAAAGAILRANGADHDARVVPLAAGLVPLLVLWVLSPSIAHALGAPAVRRERRVPPSRQAAAMRFALLHWRFFERFMTEETNWLAPDNFQEDPEPVIASRTSPTNMGLQLLSTMSACDLGMLTVPRAVELLERAFRALERMRRYRGHFYNWYDVRDLRVLEPAYISTVDSGNLAGHLIAFRQACFALSDAPLFDARAWLPLEAALGLAEERLRVLELPAGELPSNDESFARARRTLRAARAMLATADRDASPADALARLDQSLREAADAAQRAGLGAAENVRAFDWLGWAVKLVAERRAALADLAPHQAPGRGGRTVAAYPSLRDTAAKSADSRALIARLGALAERAGAYAAEMDFRFLFDHDRSLFSIGYREDAHALDASYYDLLASEARLASFVAIAKDDVPVEHWFRLGRTLTRSSGETALVSWSGSMFEYLMPLLVMRSLPFTVLDQTHRNAVRRQMAYGSAHDVPWGVSESAYNLRDRFQTYQYRAFGVPDLALKRGLGRDLVVAPYATALATLVMPRRALDNLAALERLGALGPYGFRDAVDYTRPVPGATLALVGTYMAHHVGMSLVALTNALTDQIWQRRFHSDPLVRASELLLYERIPRRLVFKEPQSAEAEESLPDPELERPSVREVDGPDTPQPHVALLGHLPYTVMVSHCGSGYSRYQKLAVTRWRSDGTLDDTGQFCYVRDLQSGRVWSAAHQPVCAPADWYRALLATDRFTVDRGDGDVRTRLEIAVVPEDAAEVRRVTLTNDGDTERELELTSYGEIALSRPDADRAHPAFSNLFVETEWHDWCEAVTATRRPRSSEEMAVWGVHVVAVCPARVDEATCETDRARFIGRGRTTRDPVALDAAGPLSMTTGEVLDPVFALRVRVRLAPGQSASVAFTTLVADTREHAFELADRYHDPLAAQRALDLAWTSAQAELRELGISPSDAAAYQELAGHLFYPNPALGAAEDAILRNRGGQPRLWKQGLSGDWPIVLASIDAMDGLSTLRQLLAAHQYWRRRGMRVDLVILNTHDASYLQELGDAITATVYASSESGVVDQPGGVFMHRRELADPDDLLMLRATARVHVPCDGRALGRVVANALAEARAADTETVADFDGESALRRPVRSTPPALRVVRHILGAASSFGFADDGLAHVRRASVTPVPPAAPSAADNAALDGLPPLTLDNGLGGFTSDGDYEIRLRGNALPPAPWTNIVANPRGGFVVSERGGGFAWAENSYFYRLTPWHNDPVSDAPGDMLYLRDEESGALWSATPAPAGSGAAYVVRHGAGWSSFEHERDGLQTRLTMGVDGDEPVKLSVLRLTNRGTRARRLTVTAYVEWTLGAQREHTQHQVCTALDTERRAMFAWNTFDPQFADRVAFCALSEPLTAHTADRREFLGRNGTARAPVALQPGRTLSGRVGAAMDPCAAMQCAITLAPGETRELVVALGAGAGEDDARRLAETFGDFGRARAALDENVRRWSERLAVVRVRTPEPSFDAIVNRWTLYQALACRMWARSALYQSSGAYGFRDQLQDVTAFVYAEPAVAREHIVRAAARQFVEGDVQHWWHPQSGRGVRTRFSDDLAWLPYVVDQYVKVTGDASVLDEQASFLTMRALAPHEQEVYDLPQQSDERASIYEHCARALRKACTTGAHGLPLMGCGDWNDGMSRVGVEGRGESVWLAWFLLTTLRAFAEHAERRGQPDDAATWRAQADAYSAAADAHAWDGAWYRRAYFDDGTPLGSAANDECQIDSIAQSWSVISGAGASEKRARAMRSFEERLVRDDARLLMLLTPPFDTTEHDPGYIKGYLPGVRENGAQYTHAALWAVLATAMSGNADRAFALYQMINPLTHASTPADVARYKVEPYVVAADVYTASGQLGRGGWTWYTGSASWMYRIGLETILGFTKRGNTLRIAPSVPSEWPEYAIDYRFGASVYAITVRQPDAVRRTGAVVEVDGVRLETDAIPLVDDGARHTVVIMARG